MSVRRLTPGPITYIECANPVCEESKCLCSRHLLLAREASQQCQRRRELARKSTAKGDKTGSLSRSMPRHYLPAGTATCAAVQRRCRLTQGLPGTWLRISPTVSMIALCNLAPSPLISACLAPAAAGYRPILRPPLDQRGYSEETQSLLLSLLASGRSVNAVKDALQKMGLSSCQQELERVAAGLIEELDLRNTRPLDPDLLALFLAGKYVELRDGDRLRPACIYVIVGLRRDGKKQVLTCLARVGRENLEDWKAVLRNLIERGLRRILSLVQDDFSGLLSIAQGLFPNTDVQLCTVHMQRNAKNHLNKSDNTEFQQRWRTSNPPGTWTSPTCSSKNFANASLTPIPPSSRS